MKKIYFYWSLLFSKKVFKNSMTFVIQLKPMIQYSSLMLELAFHYRTVSFQIRIAAKKDLSLLLDFSLKEISTTPIVVMEFKMIVSLYWTSLGLFFVHKIIRPLNKYPDYSFSKCFGIFIFFCCKIEI